MNDAHGQSYWILAPGRGELRPAPSQPGDGVELKAAYSGISAGTERLVGQGRVPPALHQIMRVPGMAGDFGFPLTYGYSWVGRDAEGRAFFTMHPHQKRIRVAETALIPLPAGLPLARATLFPNLETAFNGWLDAEVTVEDSLAVVGGGLVGVLLGFVAHHFRGEPTWIVETNAVRREQLATLPWLRVAAPEEQLEKPFSLVFHTSAAAAGLQWSLEHLAFEGRVVELSWYGDTPVNLPLGGAFHYQRHRLIASQVGTVARPLRGPDGHQRRTAAVLKLLADDALDLIPREVIPFADLPAAMMRLYRGDHFALHALVDYGQTA